MEQLDEQLLNQIQIDEILREIENDYFCNYRIPKKH